MDDEAVYLDANESAAELLGVPREDIIGRTLNDFAVEAVSDEVWTSFKAAGEGRGELRFRRPDGEIREAEFDAVASISPGLHISVLRDVTERHHLDKQRARINLTPSDGCRPGTSRRRRPTTSAPRSSTTATSPRPRSTPSTSRSAGPRSGPVPRWSRSPGPWRALGTTSRDAAGAGHRRAMGRRVVGAR